MDPRLRNFVLSYLRLELSRRSNLCFKWPQVARETEEARKKFQKDKEVAEVLLLQQKSIEAHNLEQRQRSKDEEAKLKEKNLKEIQEEEAKGKYLLKMKMTLFWDAALTVS